MKQKDIALIVVVVSISAVISIFISKSFISSPKNREQSVEVVTPIIGDGSSFTPDAKYFNSNSVDPTKNITIGDSNNTQPFNKQ